MFIFARVVAWNKLIKKDIIGEKIMLIISPLKIAKQFNLFVFILSIFLIFTYPQTYPTIYFKINVKGKYIINLPLIISNKLIPIAPDKAPHLGPNKIAATIQNIFPKCIMV